MIAHFASLIFYLLFFVIISLSIILSFGLLHLCYRPKDSTWYSPRWLLPYGPFKPLKKDAVLGLLSIMHMKIHMNSHLLQQITIAIVFFMVTNDQFYPLLFIFSYKFLEQLFYEEILSHLAVA